MAYTFNWFDGVKVHRNAWDSKLILTEIKESIALIRKIRSGIATNEIILLISASRGQEEDVFSIKCKK